MDVGIQENGYAKDVGPAFLPPSCA